MAFIKIKNLKIKKASEIFKALGDESRLRILNLIYQNEEMCISDLEKILEFTQTKTSRHLTYLKNSGILTFRRYNHWVFYAIKDEVFEILKQIFQFLRKDQLLQKDQQLYQTLYTNRELAVNKMQRSSWQKPLNE